MSTRGVAKVSSGNSKEEGIEEHNRVDVHCRHIYIFLHTLAWAAAVEPSTTVATELTTNVRLEAVGSCVRPR
jgi:hypothetical protein